MSAKDSQQLARAAILYLVELLNTHTHTELEPTDPDVMSVGGEKKGFLNLTLPTEGKTGGKSSGISTTTASRVPVLRTMLK